SRARPRHVAALRGVPAVVRPRAGGAVRGAATSVRRQPRGCCVRTATLGRTGLEITRVGFGAWAIGGGNWDWGWGDQDDDDSIAAIHRALELGVNWIDTAAQYGFGHSEEVVARALEGVEPRPFVFTKGGQPEGPNRSTIQTLKRDSLRRECEASLRRLQ